MECQAIFQAFFFILNSIPGPAPGVALEGAQVGRVLDTEGVRWLLLGLQKDQLY